jgi:mono/diheme cytochrome c family protein
MPAHPAGKTMPEITYALLKPIIVKDEPGEHNMIQPSGMRRISFFGLLLLALAGCASAQLTTPEAHRAADIWQASCSFCHGIDGKPPAEWAEKGMRKFGTFGMKMGFFFGGDKMRAGIAKTIAEGKGTEMRPFKEHLTKQEIEALVRHIENL